ncbi:hypothetical protein EJB05_56071, partial [Eragrostis curvula]
MESIVDSVQTEDKHSASAMYVLRHPMTSSFPRDFDQQMKIILQIANTANKPNGLPTYNISSHLSCSGGHCTLSFPEEKI